MNSLSFAYIFQAVNIAVAFLMVPLLLHHLSAPEYALWLLFSSICGATVQLQSAILGVSTKEIAVAYHRGAPQAFRAALSRSRRAYAALAFVVAGPVLLAGAGYFRITLHAGTSDITAWAVLAGSYAIVYLFAPNNAVLLATERVGLNSNINTATRLLFFGVTLTFLESGFLILAPCLALAVSSIMGVTANTIYAKRRVAEFVPRSEEEVTATARGSICRYGLYTFSAFMLYNGALIIVALLFPSETAPYGLALQTSAILSSMALVPLQVWLGRLVRADQSEERRELRLALIVCNLLFGAGYLCLIGIAPPLLRLIGANVAFPGVGVLALMYAAFAVELNISVLANHLTAKGDYSFIKWYAVVAFFGLSAGVFSAWLCENLWFGFLLVPLAIQVVLSLPFIIGKTIASLNLDFPWFRRHLIG